MCLALGVKTAEEAKAQAENEARLAKKLARIAKGEPAPAEPEPAPEPEPEPVVEEEKPVAKKPAPKKRGRPAKKKG